MQPHPRYVIPALINGLKRPPGTAERLQQVLDSAAQVALDQAALLGRWRGGLQREPRTDGDHICRTYLLSRSGAGAALMLRDAGIRTQRGTQYTPKEIADFIDNPSSEVDPDLHEFAQWLRQEAKTVMRKLYPD